MEVGVGVDSVVIKFFFDVEDLVEFGGMFGVVRSIGFDFISMEIDRDIGDGDIFGFIRLVRDYDILVIGVGVFGSLDGFGKGIDLVDFE